MIMPVNGHFHYPRIGDKFWDRGKFKDREGQPNGKIRHVDRHEKEILVEFFDKSIETYSLDDILGCWEAASFGGTWMLYPKLTRAERLKLAGIT